MAGFTDIHHHIVYGVDDGAASLDMSLDMLRAARQDNISYIIATAHMEPGEKAFDMPLYLARMRELNALSQQEGLGVRIFPGGEILFTGGDPVVRALHEGNALTLVGTRFVLIEFLPDDPYDTLREAARRLTNDGYRPIFAHIERYDCLLRDSSRVQELRDLFDVRMQMNASSIVRDKGKRNARFVEDALGGGLIDYVATDAHNCTSRPVMMRACFRVLAGAYGREAALGWLGGRQMEVFRA